MGLGIAADRLCRIAHGIAAKNTQLSHPCIWNRGYSPICRFTTSISARRTALSAKYDLAWNSALAEAQALRDRERGE